jgi:hypothetical protein
VRRKLSAIGCQLSAKQTLTYTSPGVPGEGLKTRSAALRVAANNWIHGPRIPGIMV